MKRHDIPLVMSAALCPPPSLAANQPKIIPILKDQSPLPVRTLHWRFWTQSAARQGDWKLLKLSDQKTFLFNLSKDKEEKNNLAEQHPHIVQRLESSLTTWATQLIPTGLPIGESKPQEKAWYQHYFQHP